MDASLWIVGGVLVLGVVALVIAYRVTRARQQRADEAAVQAAQRRPAPGPGTAGGLLEPDVSGARRSRAGAVGRPVGGSRRRHAEQDTDAYGTPLDSDGSLMWTSPMGGDDAQDGADRGGAVNPGATDLFAPQTAPSRDGDWGSAAASSPDPAPSAPSGDSGSPGSSGGDSGGSSGGGGGGE